MLPPCGLNMNRCYLATVLWLNKAKIKNILTLTFCSSWHIQKFTYHTNIIYIYLFPHVYTSYFKLTVNNWLVNQHFCLYSSIGKGLKKTCTSSFTTLLPPITALFQFNYTRSKQHAVYNIFCNRKSLCGRLLEEERDRVNCESSDWKNQPGRKGVPA